MKVLKNISDHRLQKESRILALLFAFFISLSALYAQNDTMYIMKQGNIWGKFKVSEVDSIIFYKPNTPVYSTFIDSRDNRTYKTVKIGNQTWMAENLAYLPSVVGPTIVSSSVPYYYVYDYIGTMVADAKATTNYTTYGVLYNWIAAMNGAESSTDPIGVQGVCPAGWHLPNVEEWTIMEHYLIANGYNYDGTFIDNKIAKSLASASGWFSVTGAGTVGNTDYPAKRNATGFSALPGGNRDGGEGEGGFSAIGSYGAWWNATKAAPGYAYYRGILDRESSVHLLNYFVEWGFSVRCVKD